MDVNRRSRSLIADGEKAITALAEENGLSRSYVSIMLNLICLAPDITEAILNGTQPKDLRVKDLLQPMPLD